MVETSTALGPLDHESRAREWIRTLTQFKDRFAGTPSERQAAEQVGEWMRTLGMQDVAIRPAPGGPRAGFALALHAAIGALGCFWGGMIGAALALSAAWSFNREVRHGGVFLTRLFHPPESVTVEGRSGAQTPTRRVVLSAHVDTAQAGWIFSPSLADRFARLNLAVRRADGQPPGPHTVPEALLIVGALLALGAWFGAFGFIHGLARASTGVALLVTCGLGLQWALSPGTPGANDNASAVAAMLLCGERLRDLLPPDVELWLVGTGAEEVGGGGIIAFLDRHADWSRDNTFYINFECVGGGTLHYIASEGMLGKVNYPPLLLELARRVAAGGAFGDITPTDLLAGTDGHVPAERRYPALSLISLEANGVPRHYHRTDDTVEGIDLGTVVRSANFAAAVAEAALSGAAGPYVK